MAREARCRRFQVLRKCWSISLVASSIACAWATPPADSPASEQDGLLRDVFAPLLTPELVSGRTEAEGQLLVFVQEQIARDPHVTRLVALLYLSGESLENMDRVLNPTQGGAVVELAYFSRSTPSVEDLAFVLVEERTTQRNGSDEARAATKLIVLRYDEDRGWVRR